VGNGNIHASGGHAQQRADGPGAGVPPHQREADEPGAGVKLVHPHHAGGGVCTIPLLAQPIRC
jgi:hypothetical protein